MQQIDALCRHTVTPQFGKRGAAPYVRCHTPIEFQQFGGGDDFTENTARAHQLHTRFFCVRTFAEQIHPLENVGLGTFRHRRVRVVFIHDGDVVIDMLHLLVHALQAVVHDDGQLIAEGRVIGNAVRDGGRHQVTVAILVLQAFTVQRGTAGGATEQETAYLHVAGRPGQIAHTLEAEHGIENVERNHVLAVIGVAGAGRHPRAECACFIDSFLQYLPGFVFFVKHQLAGIYWLVKLTDRRIDTQLAEHAFHAEGARFVGDDRHDTRTELLVTEQGAQRANKNHGGGNFALFRAFQQRLEHRQLRHLQRWNIVLSDRERSSEFFARCFEIFYFR